MREEIINLLSEKQNMSLSATEILIKINTKDRQQLNRTLSDLLRDGILDYSEKKDKYMLFENSHLKKGNIIVNSKGDFLVRVDTRVYDISHKNLKSATFNDKVAVEIENNQAKVVRVISRDEKDYVALVENYNGRLFVNDKRFGLIDVSKTRLPLVEGHKILVTHKNGKVFPKSIIGHINDPGIDIKEIVYERGFEIDFPKEVMDEVNILPTELSDDLIEEELLKGRIDLRDKNIFTIDCDETKDIDDAVSIKKNSDGTYELGVYIADVAHFVSEDSAINKESIKRGTSIYPPGSVIPEIPHALSNGICSLNPDVDRLVVFDYIKFDENGNVISYDIKEGIIKSRKKMAYSSVNRLLDNEVVSDYEEYRCDLETMYELSSLIEQKFKKNGFLEFNVGEVSIKLDEDYKPTELVKRTSGKAEKIIEYFMLIANIERSKYASNIGLPWIYRVHDKPSEEKLDRAYKLLKFQKGNNKYAGAVSRDLQRCIELESDKETREIANKLLITCLAKAKFSYINIGHFALGIDTYGQGTSPIRRGGDLRNQRIIKNYLHNGYDDTVRKYKNVVKDEAVHFSSMEKLADSVEREATQMKISEYMERYLNREYVGYISGISKRGFWVLLDNGVEGFVSVDTLPCDTYTFDDNEMVLSGNNYSYKLFDKCNIIVSGTDKIKRRLDFVVKNIEQERGKVLQRKR